MSGNVAIATEKSNPAPAVLDSFRNELGRTILAVNRVLRAKFGRKTWASVALLLGIEERTARHRLAGTRHYDFWNVVRLLRSEIGFEILKALMGDPKHWPAWFKTCAAKIKEAKLLTDMQQMKLLLEETTNQTAADVAKLAGDE